jgi:hypothetical protein
MMVGVPLGIVSVIGQGFGNGPQVLIDGQPALTMVENASTLQIQIDYTFDSTVATHQISVQNGGQVSNSLPFTVYAPQQGHQVMRAIPGFLVGENEHDAPFIVAADVNGDGRADVIMPGPPLSNSESIAILFGQANGTLSAAQYIPMQAAPYFVAVGDVDGNGTSDLVSINNDNVSSTTVSLIAGDGHGNFQAPVVQQTFSGLNRGPAFLVDLDGDGQLDLVLEVEQQSGSSGSLVWLKNTSGQFGPPVTLATTGINYLAVADINADGKPDIVYIASSAATGTQSINLSMNQGNGKFKNQSAGGLSGVVGIPNVLDFNLDGIPDLVVEVQQSTGGQLVSFTGNGDGSFTQVASVNTPGMAQLVAGDFDHDGFPDLAGPTGLEPSEIMFFFGDGHGNFDPQIVVGPEGQYAAVGDFNGDGIPDVVVPDRFNLVSLALGRTDRNFPSALALDAPAAIGGLSAGDINGDGLPEIFVGGDYDLVDNIILPGTVYLNLGNSTFQLAASTDPTSFMVADLTGRGVVDLLGSATENLEIWPNNSSLNFSPSPVTLPEQTPNATVADVDGDGYPDIVASCPSSPCGGQVLYGNGAYAFTPVTAAGLGWPYIVGDFNGDRKKDFATGSTTLLNVGGRTFQQVLNNNLPLINGALAVVADFNGDGKDDVALNLPGDTSIYIYYSNGDGTFYQGTVLDPGLSTGDFVAGDFDGDGRIDLAVGSQLSYQVSLLFNNGNSQFSRSFFASGAFAAPIVTADLNHNGKLDLVIANYQFVFAPPNVNVVFHQ